MRVAMLLVPLAALIHASPALAEQKIYTWTDAQGVKHFGATPPAGSAKDLSETQAPSAKEAPLSPERRKAAQSKIEQLDRQIEEQSAAVASDPDVQRLQQEEAEKQQALNAAEAQARKAERLQFECAEKRRGFEAGRRRLNGESSERIPPSEQEDYVRRIAALESDIREHCN